jgi:hypothetical protein
MSSRPVVSKSAKFGVAKRPSLMRAIAAIIPSGALTGRPERGAHDVAVGERRGFCEGEDPIGKRWRQEAKPCSKRAALWSGRIFPMPKAISAIVTAGGASSASFRTSQAITAGLGVLRSVSEITLVSRKIKAPVLD